MTPGERRGRDSAGYKQAKKGEKNQPASLQRAAERLNCSLECAVFAHGNCQPGQGRPRGSERPGPGTL